MEMPDSLLVPPRVTVWTRMTSALSTLLINISNRIGQAHPRRAYLPSPSVVTGFSLQSTPIATLPPMINMLTGDGALPSLSSMRSYRLKAGTALIAAQMRPLSRGCASAEERGHGALPAAIKKDIGAVLRKRQGKHCRDESPRELPRGVVRQAPGGPV